MLLTENGPPRKSEKIFFTNNARNNSNIISSSDNLEQPQSIQHKQSSNFKIADKFA
jgi:hypothetical protein